MRYLQRVYFPPEPAWKGETRFPGNRALQIAVGQNADGAFAVGTFLKVFGFVTSMPDSDQNVSRSANWN